MTRSLTGMHFTMHIFKEFFLCQVRFFRRRVPNGKVVRCLNGAIRWTLSPRLGQ